MSVYAVRNGVPLEVPVSMRFPRANIQEHKVTIRVDVSITLLMGDSYELLLTIPPEDEEKKFVHIASSMAESSVPSELGQALLSELAKHHSLIGVTNPAFSASVFDMAEQLLRGG